MIEKYNPENYTNRIKDIIREALSKGLKVNIQDNKVIVENTVAEVETYVDMNTLLEG